MRPALPPSNGILGTRFLPFVKDQGQLSDWQQKEENFFSSYKNLTSLFKIPKADLKGIVYPHNIALAYSYLRDYFIRMNKPQGLVIISTPDQPCCLGTVEPFDTYRTLYYIPVCALYNLRKSKKTIRAYNLLLSVYAYLLQVVRFPSYQTGDYMSGCHEMIEDWVLSNPDDWEDDSFQTAVSEFRMAEHWGVKLCKQIIHPYHLQQWEHRLASFTPRSDAEQNLLKVAQDFYRLYVDFPSRSYYDNFLPGAIGRDEEYVTLPDQYLSFIWSLRGWLFHELIDHVNSATQEDTHIEEPVMVSLYHTSPATPFDNLEFEKRLIDLLDELIELTKPYCHE